MKVVIEIPEKVYNALTHTEFDANLVVDEMRKAIANGTPLPAKHGRLIDADRLTRAEIMHLWYHLPNGDIACPKVDIDHAPTIIEGSEGNERKAESEETEERA